MKKIALILILSLLATSVSAQVDILQSGQISATCNDGRRGAELNVTFRVKNMKGQRVHVRCLIAPQAGDGKVLSDSDPTGEYTLPGGLSGQEREFSVNGNDVRLDATFFVPFSVMDFHGNYSAQSLKSEITITDPLSGNILATLNQTYNNLQTHTVSVRQRTDTCNIETDYLGGCLEWENFAACAGNEIVISDLPKWVTRDEEGLHILDNDTPKPRSTRLYVSSSEGGNIVELNIAQQGRKTTQKATARINSVWMDERISDSRDPIGILIIHVDCEVTGARGKEIRLYARFCKPDDDQPLLNAFGNPIELYNRASVTYAEAGFDDFSLTTFYNRFTSATNNTARQARFYICLSEDEGRTCLALSGPYTIKW